MTSNTTLLEVRLLDNMHHLAEQLPYLFAALAPAAEQVDLKEYFCSHVKAVEAAALSWQNTLLALKTLADVHIAIDSKLLGFQEDHPASPCSQEQMADLQAVYLPLGVSIAAFSSATSEQDVWVNTVSGSLGALQRNLESWLDFFNALDPAVYAAKLRRTFAGFEQLLAGSDEYLQGSGDALAQARHAVKLLFLAPITAAQHAALDFSLIVDNLLAVLKYLARLNLQASSETWSRNLAGAIHSSNQARACCEVLLDWIKVSA